MTVKHEPILPNATRILATFVSELTYEKIPHPVSEWVKSCILDSIGCGIWGSSLPWTQKLARVLQAEGSTGVATVFGCPWKTSAANAALLNSTACHAYELDDIHKLAGIHAGSVNIPVALALAEHCGNKTGKDVITAIVAGYEVACRIGAAAAPALFFRGFHPQGTIGTFAAAAAAASMLGLTPAQAQDSLGIAGTQAAGLMAAQEGAMVKRMHSGRAAQSGVYGGLLAREGFTGIQDVVEAGFGGFLSTYSGEPNPEKLLVGLGEIWETANVGFKPYASVASIHCALSALEAIMAENQLKAADLKSIVAGVGKTTYVHCAWEYKSQGVTAAQMNLFFGLAAIAVDGDAFVGQYSEGRLNDPEILRVIGLTEASIDPAIDALGRPGRHAARITVQTIDGRAFEKFVVDRPGSPEAQLSPERWLRKFASLTEPVIGSRYLQIADMVRSFDEIENIASFTKLLTA